MYYLLIKPLSYLLSVEKIHKLVIWLLRYFASMSIIKSILRSVNRVDHPSLEREVFGLKFSNPVGVAAGFDVNGEVTSELGAIGFGFVEVGAITPDPQMGNPKPRIFRLRRDHAIINRMGHPNKGWEYAKNRLRSRTGDVIVGCNITRNNNTPHSGAAREYLKTFRNLYQYVDYFSVNINYAYLSYDGDEESIEQRIEELITPLFEFRRGQSDYRPILIKVSADMDDDLIDIVSRVLIKTPLDGVVAVNGLSSRENLRTSSGSVEKMGSGYLSGDPLRARALEVVRRIHKVTDGAYPIIGAGGISTAEDAQAMLDAGASLVQLHTAIIYNGVSVAGKICKGLALTPVAEDNKER